MDVTAKAVATMSVKGAKAEDVARTLQVLARHAKGLAGGGAKKNTRVVCGSSSRKETH